MAQVATPPSQLMTKNPFALQFSIYCAIRFQEAIKVDRTGVLEVSQVKLIHAGHSERSTQDDDMTEEDRRRQP